MPVRFSHLDSPGTARRNLHRVRVLVRLFASYREAAGRGHFDLELPPGTTVRDAIARIVREHPLVAEGRRVVIARNREYVGLDAPLADGDELALIPPVSGGDARTLAAVAVSEAPLSVDEALAIVRDEAFGGVVVFLGTVRSRSRGKRILHLEYEAYIEMAEAKMREIAERLGREHGPLRIAMHHRVGDLRVGEVAVIVAAAAPHRDAAFAAARGAIDELKSVVPIWKKEHAEDGAIWIEEHA
jgi:MoaE-MoaD fusion protein